MIGRELFQLFLDARLFTLKLLSSLLANFFRMRRAVSGNRSLDVFRLQRIINFFRARLSIRLLSYNLAQLFP